MCKHGALFPITTEDFVDKNGKWGPKRLYGMMNGQNLAILVNIQCNNNCKILTNSGDIKNIIWYVISYITKKQAKNHSILALMAKTYVFHTDNLWHLETKTFKNAQREMIFWVMQTINHQQELAVVMVISYLMGWGDVYCSCHYTPLFQLSIFRELIRFLS